MNVSLAKLRSAGPPRDSVHIGEQSRVCGATLELLLKQAKRDEIRADWLDRLDSMATSMDPGVYRGQRFADAVRHSASITVARLRAEKGDYLRALATIRRKPSYGDGLPLYLTTFLREEGRIAALAGDTAAAQRAYHHYLVLRADPESRLTSQRDRVAAELARLRSSAR